MSSAPRRVIVLSNDVTPGMGMPVAAPGLRAHGIAAGLRARGFFVEVVVDRGPQARLWSDSTPPPGRPGAITLHRPKLMEYIAARDRVTVVMTNSNLVGSLRALPSVRYVMDFFAPKMLELAYGRGDEHPVDALAELRGRKLQAIELADGFIVNGAKKLPYVIAWLLQGSRDIRSLPVEVVNMAFSSSFRELSERAVPRLGMAGYLQGWSRPAPWIQSVLGLVDDGLATFDVLAPAHWGRSGAQVESTELDAVLRHPRVTVHEAMQFAEYQNFVADLDVVLDVFDHSLEREFAMVTRTVGALACGRPVVHPDFTEVSPFIEASEAGWLVGPDDPSSVGSALTQIVSDPGEIARRAANARSAWEQHFEPEVAAAGLERVIDAIWS